MEEIFIRFDHIGDQILEQLDSQSLIKCKYVGKRWKSFIDMGKPQSIKIVNAYTSIDENKLRIFF